MLRYRFPRAYGQGLWIGASGWKYDSWKGLFYDLDKTYRGEDYLPDYARFLNSVEVDQWFYSLFPVGVKLPDPKTVRDYARGVPDDFRFSVKAPNALTLTHYQLHPPAGKREEIGPPNPNFLSRDVLRRFLDLLEPLGRKLGPVMFQFEYLNKRKMPSAEEFQDRFGEFTDRAPRGFAYGLETRNPNYLTKEFFSFLSGHGLGYVGFEGDFMPHLDEVFERHEPKLRGFCVLRLHGSGRQEMERAKAKKWDAIVAPRNERIEAAARIVRSNLRNKVLSYVNISNHLEGSAPLTIERFLTALKAGKG